MSDKNQYGTDVSLSPEDAAIMNDLIIGRKAILAMLKLSHWKYMGPYLGRPDCPINKVGKRWMTRKSLMRGFLSDSALCEAASHAPAESADLMDDLIIGQDAILTILKLSQWWKYMDPYLKHRESPIQKVSSRWLVRRSLLDTFLNKLMYEKSEVVYRG